jgi:hypothetical protein
VPGALNRQHPQSRTAVIHSRQLRGRSMFDASGIVCDFLGRRFPIIGPPTVKPCDLQFRSGNSRSRPAPVLDGYGICADGVGHLQAANPIGGWAPNWMPGFSVSRSLRSPNSEDQPRPCRRDHRSY